jgi:hypothetical protein
MCFSGVRTTAATKRTPAAESLPWRSREQKKQQKAEEAEATHLAEGGAAIQARRPLPLPARIVSDPAAASLGAISEITGLEKEKDQGKKDPRTRRSQRKKK